MYFNSQACRSQCLHNDNNPDRWSHIACSVCCAADVDGDGVISQEDRERFYDAYCGDDEDGKNRVIS